MSSSGTTENGSVSSATDGSMTWFMNTPSPGWAAHADPAVADAPLGVGQRHQRAAAAVAEQHDSLGAAAAHLLGHRLDVDRCTRSCRQSVSLFMYRVPKPNTA